MTDVQPSNLMICMMYTYIIHQTSSNIIVIIIIFYSGQTAHLQTSNAPMVIVLTLLIGVMAAMTVVQEITQMKLIVVIQIVVVEGWRPIHKV